MADLSLSDRLLAVLMEQPTPTTNEEAEVLAEVLASVAAPEPWVTVDEHGNRFRIMPTAVVDDCPQCRGFGTVDVDSRVQCLMCRGEGRAFWHRAIAEVPDHA